MRRQERRRGATVTGEADREGVEPRKDRYWERPMVLMGQQATVLCTLRRAQRATPGSKAVSSLTWRLRGNQGDPPVGVDETRSRTSVRSEEERGGWRKSEAPIRARKPGNAGGAKGCRYEATDRGDMVRTQGRMKP